MLRIKGIADQGGENSPPLMGGWNMTPKKMRTGILFLAPAMLFYCFFVVFSIARVIYYSFFKWNGLNFPQFVGVSNYVRLVNDQTVLAAFRNNLIAIAMALIIQIGIALILTISLSNCKFGARFFRTVYFVPAVISGVAVAMMFGQAMNPDYGLINTSLRLIGLGTLARPWLSNSNTAIYAALLPQTLQYIGWNVIILVAGIYNIPDSLYEAAYLDGVSNLQKTWYITLPLLWEVIQICIISAITGSLQGFTHVMVLTGGGPNSATELVGLLMYHRTFQWLQFGYGSSISVGIFLVGLLFSVLFKRYFSSDKIEY
ncbi:MAG TPA: sugar ABC transporter permease [Firmicutes bacterium]|nr:sugar ABC transporter permease [Bacillota bacterium]